MTAFRWMAPLRSNRGSNRGRVVTTDIKTPEWRVRAIDGDSAAALRTWQAQEAKEGLRAGEVWVVSDLVLTWQDGSGATPDSLRGVRESRREAESSA